MKLTQFLPGDVSIFVGNGRQSTKDGIRANASFNRPSGIAINELTGDIYVSEGEGNVIRHISPQGTLQCKSHSY